MSEPRVVLGTVVPAEDPLSRGTCEVCFAVPGVYCVPTTEANLKPRGSWAHLPRMKTRPPAFPQHWNPTMGERISVQTVDGTVVLGTITDSKKSDDGSRITLTIQGDG